MTWSSGQNWAGTRLDGYIPVDGRRVPPVWIADDSLYWSYDEDLYFDLG